MHVSAGCPLRFSVAALFVACVSLSPAAVAADSDSLPVLPDGIDLQDGDTFVFLGDSITHQRLYTQYVETFFYTRYPQRRIRFHNAGVGGAQAWDALQRLQADVTDFKPKYVSILLGMNDGRYQPFNREIFEKYQRDMNEVVTQLMEAGAAPILMSPTMFDSRAASLGRRPRSPEMLAEYNSVLAYFGRWLQHQATESGTAYVDMYGPLNRITLEQRKEDAEFTLIRDAVHPDAPGQVVMALAMIEQLGLAEPLSSIVIRVGGRRGPVPRAKGGEISRLEQTKDGLSFEWLADGLPWVLPERAEPGVRITRAAHRVSRETLRVVGLEPGQYDIIIDGVAVARRPAERLALQVELQSNGETAQYQQALAVATLNEQKNNGPVKQLRDAWRDFQAYARVRRDAAAQPNNQELQAKLKDLQKKMETHEQRVEDAQQQIADYEDRIYQTNQPKTRHFVIRKVTK